MLVMITMAMPAEKDDDSGVEHVDGNEANE